LVTLKDIAIEVGCSKTACSLALNGSSRISESVRKKILKTAENLLYVPHFAAKQLAVGKSGLIGVYLSKMSHNDIWAMVAEGLLRKLNTGIYQPILGLDHKEDIGTNIGISKMKSWLQTFVQLNVEALIVVAYQVTLDVPIPRLLEKKSPLFVGVYPPGKMDEHNYIALDRISAYKLAFNYLLSKGRRNITIASSSSGGVIHDTDTLEIAHSLGAKAQSYDLGTYYNSRCRFNSASKLADSIASKSIKPDACFFVDAPTAAIFVNCLISKGIKVPDDISVIGYDYTPMADMSIVPLTTVEQPIDLIINETVDSIYAILKDEKKQVKRQKIIQHRLVIRQST
jgi:LacI family transcriptional regulator